VLGVWFEKYYFALAWWVEKCDDWKKKGS
jgi:hypothetical protein